MKDKWQTKVLVSILVVSLLPFFSVVVMALMPLNPAEIKSIAIINLNKRVLAGERVRYVVEMVKHTDKPARIIRELINERTSFYTTIESNTSPGESKKEGSLWTSRGDMPGTYHMLYTMVYTYFGFRDVSVSAVSDDFEMVNDPELRGAKGDTGQRGQKGVQGEKGEKGGLTIFGK